MDRASTIRFYDHYGHVSAAVCYQNTLHARTGDGRLDHARTHEPRDRKGVNCYKAAVTLTGSVLRSALSHLCRYTLHTTILMALWN